MQKYILILDSDVVLLSMLKMRLKRIGHTVDTAETGWDGLTKLAHADYDVVLLDDLMPEITGLTVLQHVQKRHPSVPVVMMSSHTSSQVMAQALAAGAQACLAKPVDPVELDRALQCSVGRHGSNVERRMNDATVSP